MSESTTLPAPTRAVDGREQELRKGALLDRYVVLDQLGATSVFAAYDLKLNRKVAVKLLPADAEGQRRLEREAQAQGRLSHPHVLAVHDVGVQGEHVFVAMDLVEGTTLSRWLETPRPWREVWRRLRDAGTGLAAAHDAGLFHGAFSAESILVRTDGHAFVAGFGRVAGGDARGDQRAFADTVAAALGDRAPSRLVARGRAGGFASLRELLAAEPVPQRAPWVAVAVLALVAALASLQAGRGPAVSVCGGAGARLAGVWDDDLRGRVERAFLATGKPYAADVFAHVADAFDRYAADWTAARTEACEATEVRHEQSPALLDLRMACLDRRLEALGALARVFGEADASVVVKASQASDELPALSSCADAEVLRQAVPPPDDPAVRGRVAALRGEIAAAEALVRAGRFELAQRAIEPLVRTARGIPYLPIQEQALDLRARLLTQLGGKLDESVAALNEAVGIAGQIGDRERVAALTNELIWVIGTKQKRPLEALALVPVADAAVRQARDGGRSWFRLHFNVASVRNVQGDYEGALAGYREALLLYLPLAGADNAAIGRCHSQIGGILLSQGRVPEARAHFEQGLAIMERAVGREHPHYAMVLNNLGNAAINVKDYATALRYYQETEAIMSRALPADDEMLITVRTNVAMTLVPIGRVAEAEALYQKVLAAREKNPGPNHPKMASALNNYASMLMVEERWAEAEAAARRALAIREKADGPEHPDVAYPLLTLIHVLLEKGAADEALVDARRLLALREKKVAPDSPLLAAAVTMVAEAELAVGRPAAAIPLAERALVVLDKQPGADVPAARARFVLARALVLLGRDRARAVTLAELARDEYRADGPQGAHELRRVEQWLRGAR